MKKWLVITFFVVVGHVFAQDTVVVTMEICSEIAPTEFCAGTSDIVALNDDAEQSLSAGERVALQTLNTIALNASTNACAFGQLNTRAYANETWDTEALALFISGNITLTNLAQEHFMQTVTISATQGANIRSGTSEDFRVIERIAQGQTLKAVGRLADNSWLQVLLRDGQIGWLVASAVNDGVEALPVVTAETPIILNPYLPFTYVNLEVIDELCVDTIANGLLIQTEKMTFPLRYNVNGVLIDVFGTAFIELVRVETGANLLIYNLEGDVQVTATNQSEDVPTAHFTSVLLNNDAQNYIPVDVPSVSRPYRYAYLASLPIPIFERVFYVPLGDVYQYVRPKPEGDISPLSSMLATEPCRLTTGEGGTNIRAGAGTNYPILGVLGFRESADVQGRAIGTDGENWWQIAPYLWLSGRTTVTGGDCVNVPNVENPLPR